MSTVCMHAERDGIAGSLMMGFSVESATIQGLLTDAISHLRESITMGRSLNEAYDDLKEIFTTCSEVNWDGYKSPPISVDACLEAANFLELLPTRIPMPELIGGPNGDIILEWHRNNRRLFAISMSGNNKLSYAGLFGPNSRRGHLNFGDSVPDEIIKHIQKIK